MSSSIKPFDWQRAS